MIGNLPYDPHARRDTPLALKLKAHIRSQGVMPLSAYMQACLQDGEFGYYRNSMAIGSRGDFITAPEISQVFGELIGLWSVVVWQQMGQPTPFNFIELGPGRGTLMRDALRAARIVPGFLAALTLRLVECSPYLSAQQRGALKDCASLPTWCGSLRDAPSGPLIVLANEFLDALPTVQYMRQNGAWFWRGVTVDERDRLAFCAGSPIVGQPPGMLMSEVCIADTIVETVSHGDLVDGLAAIGQPVAALFVDYGHAGQYGTDTLQAVRGHRMEHPLTSPGEADLSAHVHFGAVALEAEAAGFAVDGPITQAEFLGNLGILQRASKLMAANPVKANEIETGVARLMAPNGMGTRFKVLGVRSKGLPPLPGFPVAGRGKP